MKKELLKLINEEKKKTFKTMDMKNTLYAKSNRFYEKNGGFEGFYEAVNCLIEDGEIEPVKSSGKTGTIPTLFNMYRRKNKVSVASEDILIEMQTKYHPKIDMSEFLKQPSDYLKNKGKLKQLSDFLYSEEKEHCISINERSYQIFKDEKWLASKGINFLKKVNVSIEEMNCYFTYEPFFYAKNDKKDVSILIIENKDTFYSLKKLLREGMICWNGIEFDMLIYGEGKKIIKSIFFLEELATLNIRSIYYYGDIDPVGIEIWQKLSEVSKYQILPFTYFYEKLMDKCFSNATPMVKSQLLNQKAVDIFKKYFDDGFNCKLDQLLHDKHYIPQEGLNKSDMANLLLEEMQ